MPPVLIDRAGLSVYIHWPYCSSLCTYCDFNKYLANDVDHERMTSSYIRNIQNELSLCNHTKINTIYFGGGTPSLMKPESVERIIRCLSTERTVADDVEVCKREFL